MCESRLKSLSLPRAAGVHFALRFGKRRSDQGLLITCALRFDETTRGPNLRERLAITQLVKTISVLRRPRVDYFDLRYQTLAMGRKLGASNAEWEMGSRSLPVFRPRSVVNSSPSSFRRGRVRAV